MSDLALEALAGVLTFISRLVIAVSVLRIMGVQI